MIKYLVKEPIQLIDALKEVYPDSSTKTIRDMLKNKRVSVDNIISVKANILLNKGQLVIVGSIKKPLPHGLQIIYDDKEIIIVNKPEVLLSVPLDNGEGTNILNILRRHFDTSEIFAVHRIDKETSGVMIFAKGEKSRRILDEMFKNHDFKRIYLAIVKGYVTKDSGTWKSNLIELKDFQVKSTTRENEGRTAITHFSVIKRSKNFTFLQLELETGRKHQIRIHCKDANHPIVGDKRYGSKSLDPISRICLHAYKLEFIHPFTKKHMSFSAPIPVRFSSLGFTL
ncbi:MAG: RluA family pseudouridine synthase [Parachlamydiales bacterium]|nr:RluA family pseudouridine synthase [Parachlamydiales bacterium]